MRPRTRRPRVRGAGLVEVAVALLMLSLATVGLVGLQTAARQAALEASQRTEAVALATDMLAQLRANSRSLASYSGDVPVLGQPPECDVACDPGEMLAWNRYRWGLALYGPGSGLATPAACLDFGAELARVVVSWEAAYALGDTGEGLDCGRGGTDPQRRRAVALETHIRGG